MIPNLSEILEYLGIEIDLKKFKGYYMRIFIVDPKTDDVKMLELPSGVETHFPLTHLVVKQSFSLQSEFELHSFFPQPINNKRVIITTTIYLVFIFNTSFKPIYKSTHIYILR